jgi:hypothetical protein
MALTSEETLPAGCCATLTLFQLLVFLRRRSVQMVTNQKVLSNRASDKSKSRVCGKGSIVTAVRIAFQKGGGRLPSEQGLALYNAERRVCGCEAAVTPRGPVQSSYADNRSVFTLASLHIVHKHNGIVALQHLKINRLSSFLLQTSMYMMFPTCLENTPCKQRRVSIFRAISKNYKIYCRIFEY